MRKMILATLAIMLVLSACVSSKTYKAQQTRVQMMEARQNEQDANLEMARKDIILNKEKIEQLIIGMGDVNEQLLVLDPMQDEIISSAIAIIDLQGDMSASDIAITALQTQMASLNRQLDEAIAANTRLEETVAELSLDTYDTFDAYSDYLKQLKQAQGDFATKEEIALLVEESAQLAEILDEQTYMVDRIASYMKHQDETLAYWTEILQDHEDFNESVIEEFEELHDLMMEQFASVGKGAISSEQEKQEIFEEISRIRDQLDESSDEISSLRMILGQEVSELRDSNEDMRMDMDEISDRVFAVNRELTELATDLKDVIAKERAAAEKRRTEAMAKHYKVALGEYNRHNYEKSIIYFEEFLEDYPDSDLCPNAIYWMGENYYAAGNYPKALRQFQDVVYSYSDHPKAWDAQLKIGITHYQMQDYDASYSALMLIKNYYPDYPNMKTVDRYLNKI